MRSKRDRRRAILHPEDTRVPDEPHAPAALKLINFGSPRREADRCTYADAPARFDLCLDCRYNRGAKGSGILCAHRFGLDPTLVEGLPTHYSSGDIVPLEE